MPTFDFRCKKCQRTFEYSRPFGSKRKPSCPACKSTATEKLIATPAIHFKGTGFYATDSRQSASKTHSEKAKTKPKSDEKVESGNKETPTDTTTASTPKTEAPKA